MTFLEPVDAIRAAELAAACEDAMTNMGNSADR
jgi:hypothetical protein